MAPINLVALQPVSQFSRRLGALQLCRLWSISSLILRLQWSSSPFSLIPLGMLLCSCLFLVLPLFFLHCSPSIRLFTGPAFSSCSTLFSSQNLVSFKPSCLLFPVLEYQCFLISEGAFICSLSYSQNAQKTSFSSTYLFLLWQTALCVCLGVGLLVVVVGCFFCFCF